MKRVFDFIIALSLLVALSPLLVAVALAVLIVMGRPILFVQERPGLNGTTFRMYKFRSMLHSSGAEPEARPDVQRLTPFGKFLRGSSLDELPELWNVVKGDMSLVGPRPLLVEYLPLYSPVQARRQEVRPGITGWAQVKGRNSLSWEKKFELDVWYVDNNSMWIDLKILFMTIVQVLKRDGIAQDGDIRTDIKITDII